jgi:thiosulfate dehydrogenase
MPLGAENTLTNQECRDIAYFISNLPRPAGDKQGPLVALQQQALMRIMPTLLRWTESAMERPAPVPAPAHATTPAPVAAR